jgi:ubiquitin-like 1-activating enzyme E1 A
MWLTMDHGTGMGQVTIIDDGIVQEEDLGANYFISELDVGKLSRAEASVGKIQDLNPRANLVVEKGAVDSLTEER